MALTDARIRHAKPRERDYKLADGKGLTFLIKPTGAKLWRFRCRFNGRENMLSVGKYPDTSLELARDRRDARKLLAKDIDPRQRANADSI